MPSDGESSKIFEVNTTAKLKWNLTGIPNGQEFYNIKYVKDNKEILLAITTLISNDATEPVKYQTNPFDKNRISGSINLVNGSGTATFELKNIQYNEYGDFVFETVISSKEKLGIAVEVQGKIQS